MRTHLIPFARSRALPGRRWAGFGDPFFADVAPLFGDAWAGRSPANGEVATLWPSIDVHETDVDYRISAELPGLDAADVDVEIADESLTIKGEKRVEDERETPTGVLRERRFGRFERRFRLPQNVAADKIEANFEKGVLTLVLPKIEPDTTKVEIKAA